MLFVAVLDATRRRLQVGSAYVIVLVQTLIVALAIICLHFHSNEWNENLIEEIDCRIFSMNYVQILKTAKGSD